MQIAEPPQIEQDRQRIHEALCLLDSAAYLLPARVVCFEALSGTERNTVKKEG